MTNDEIIYNEVNAKYHTPEQRRAIDRKSTRLNSSHRT